MPKYTNKTKEIGTIFDLTTDFLIKKYWTISIKLKTFISQIIARILLKQQNLNQIKHVHCIDIDIYMYFYFYSFFFFWSQNVIAFQWLSKFFSFVTKVNPSNGNETKSDIFRWDILKSDAIFFYQKTLKCFNVFQRYTQAIEMKQNQTFFQETYSIKPFFIGRKILENFKYLKIISRLS